MNFKLRNIIRRIICENEDLSSEMIKSTFDGHFGKTNIIHSNKLFLKKEFFSAGFLEALKYVTRNEDFETNNYDNKTEKEVKNLVIKYKNFLDISVEECSDCGTYIDAEISFPFFEIKKFLNPGKNKAISESEDYSKDDAIVEFCYELPRYLQDESLVLGENMSVICHQISMLNNNFFDREFLQNLNLMFMIYYNETYGNNADDSFDISLVRNNNSTMFDYNVELLFRSYAHSAYAAYSQYSTVEKLIIEIPFYAVKQYLAKKIQSI